MRKVLFGALLTAALCVPISTQAAQLLWSYSGPSPSASFIGLPDGRWDVTLVADRPIVANFDLQVKYKWREWPADPRGAAYVFGYNSDYQSVPHSYLPNATGGVLRITAPEPRITHVTCCYPFPYIPGFDETWEDLTSYESEQWDVYVHPSFNWSGEGNINVSLFLSPAPEPATWLTLVTGFALLGTALRKRRLMTAVAA